MSTQDTFVSHLIELRERLIRALLAVVLALVVLLIWPGAGAIYDFLALPLMEALPQGTRMIATGVITPFLIPLKVTTLAAFISKPSPRRLPMLPAGEPVSATNSWNGQMVSRAWLPPTACILPRRRASWTWAC